MAVRSSMAAIISRVRLLINDVSGTPVFTDQQIQDVLDSTRLDVLNGSLRAVPTFTGSTVQYLDYYSEYTDWEDDLVLKQYLTVVVTPATSENIVGHWQFAATTLPPVFITGKTYDVYRSAADLLERQAAMWALSYTVTVDGQSLQRGQVITALQGLAHTYRQKQRAHRVTAVRTDLLGGLNGQTINVGLGPNPIDYFGSGDGR